MELEEESLPDSLHDERLMAMEKEMIARNDGHGKGACCLLAPASQFLNTDQAILLAAESGDGAGKRFFRGIGIGFIKSEIGTQDGKHQPHHLLILQNSRRGAAQPVEGIDKFRVGQGMQGGSRQRKLRSAMGGNEEMRGAGVLASGQVAGQFEADERAQAMAEKGKGYIQNGVQRLCQRLHQRGQVSKKRLVPSGFPARQENRTYIQLWRQLLRPEPEKRAAATRVGK